MDDLLVEVPRFAAGLWVIVALVVLATAISWIAVRATKAPVLKRWSRGLHVIAASAWLASVWHISLRLLNGRTPVGTFARTVLVVLALLVVFPILRDLVAGLALALSGRYRLGTEVRADAYEGTITKLGLRSVGLRGRDRTKVEIPNRRFASMVVTRLATGERDAVCDLEVELPTGADAETIMRRLAEAAVLSPFASPGRSPEVFAVADAHGCLRLRIRAYVFDRAQEDRFRGDVLLRAGLLSSSGERPAPSQQT